MSDPAITVEGVWKRFRLYHERNQSLKAAMLRGGRAKYEEFWALSDVSLEIPRGTTFGLIGHNGSGKSTLLKCIARILRADRGTIAVDGSMSSLLELGAGFHPELSGRDNIYLNGSILGLSRKQLDAKYDEIVSFAGLERFVDTPVKNYSSGMYVRLGFAVAINVDPDVLLVDEVLAVGDEEFQRRCDEKFADLKAAGKTIVLVSHALDSVRRICDQAAWLDGGVLKGVGRPGELIDSYVETAHADRVEVAGGGGTRWGTGEAQIERIELIGASGQPATSVHVGEPARLRLHYVARTPVEKPVFGLGVYRADGLYVCGLNTRETPAAIPDVVEGEGFVDYAMPAMSLLPGTYELQCALVDISYLRTYDWRVKAFRFDVEPGPPHEAEGVVVLPGAWELGP